MSGSTIALAVEGLVMVLLVFTIGYCALLNTRLKRLRSDEQALKATIAELVTATEIADRAVRSLKATVGEADRALGQRMQDADNVCQELDRLVASAERARIAPPPPPEPAPVQSAAVATLHRLAASATGRPAFAGVRSR